uniref:HTH OST-type domain-containing protein n=1 Tax=Anopheles braziliensis TaxID=58242 RepID=A0A2M3Z7W9_9DIPT
MDQLKSQIRGVLISNRKQMTVQNLISDYKLLEGEDIPYKQFGFKTLDDLLGAMPDVLQVQGYGRQATIQPVITQTTQHMKELVEKSKNSPSGHYNWNKQNIPARRNFADHHWPSAKNNDYEMSNKTAFRGAPEKNNFCHNTIAERNAKRMIEIVAKNVDRLTSEAPVQVHNDRVLNETKAREPEVSSKKESEAKDAESIQLPACFPSTTTSFENDAIDQIPSTEENNIDIFEPLPASVEIGSVVTAVGVSPASNLHDIRVQLPQHATKLRTMTLAIQACHEENVASSDNNNASVHKVKHIRLGKYCMVKDNDGWFRGLVVARPECKMVKVYFIDSGLVNQVSVSNAFYLPKKYRFPRQLVRVTMGDIKPIGDRWSEGALRYINQAIFHKRMHMFIRAIDEKTNTIDAVLFGPDAILSRELVRRREAVWTS